MRKRQRTKVATLALCAVMVSVASGLAASPASAERSWGCTFSWGHECIAPWTGNVNYLLTLDPDHAVGFIGATENGYPKPKYDGRERDVCGAMQNPPGHLVVGWSCAWGQSVYTFGTTYGTAMMGTGVPNYGVAIYQVINYTEGGP